MSKGELSVRVNVDSYFLRDSLPVEVRDSRLHIVEPTTTTRTGSGETTYSLEPGLYRVAAMLEDGHVHERIANVQAGKNAPIVFDPPVGKTKILSGLFGPEDGRLLWVEGAKRIDKVPETWTFEPVADPKAVAHARFEFYGRHLEMSLPTNPLGYPPLNLCQVHAPYKRPVEVTVATERRVLHTVMGMLRSKELLRGIEVIRAATGLLRDKYQDPIGAVLGGLLLQRLGLLEQRADWVENLARDFAWLPDGRILRASLDQSSEDTDTRLQALDQILAASHERPLFTDAYSLLLRTIRRWPGDDARANERSEAIERLAPITAAVDWDQVVLTHQVQEA